MPTKIKKSTNSKIVSNFDKKEKKLPKVSANFVDMSIRREITVSQAIIRPTGLIDPKIILKPTSNQVDDVLEEVRKRVAKNQRVLITTLTKKFAEELDLYFKQLKIKSAYIHSEVETLNRLDILSDLRKGVHDVIIGINLLREGLDLPEVSLVAIFDADKEGFLRSRTSLIQIVGRAARHEEGSVIMYADKVTKSMREAIDETNRRREIQEKYNKDNNIIPQSTKREVTNIAQDIRDEMNNNENYGKSELINGPSGFEDKKQESNDGNFEIQSRFGTKKAKPPNLRGLQVFANFEMEKTAFTKELKDLNLTEAELKERLQITIDSYNFEEAAAIKDLLENF